MGFLSGVLEAVKDDPSVTTYYKDMENTLEIIKNSMHNPNGLSKAVEAVSQALGAWDDKVTEKTNALKNALSNLKNNSFATMTGSLNKLHELSGDDLKYVSYHLSNCMHEAGNLSKVFHNAEHMYNELDLTLKDKLKTAVFKINLQVKEFVTAARNTELLASVDMAKDRLDELHTEIDEKTMQRVGVLGDMLRSKFESDIHDPITQVKEDLQTAKGNLNTWMEKAKEVVQKAQTKVEEIVKMLDGKETQTERAQLMKATTKKKAVEHAAQKVHDDADKLWKAVDEAKKGLNGLVDNIKAKVTALEDVYKATLKALQSTVQTQVVAAQGKLRELDGKVKSDLDNGVKKEIKTHIDKVITTFQEGVKEVEQLKGYSARLYMQQFLIGVGQYRSEVKNLAAWAAMAKDNGDLGGALESLNSGNGRFEKFREVLRHLREDNASGKNFFAAIIADLESYLQVAINGIKNDMTTKMPLYYEHAKGTEGGRIRDAIEEIKTDVDGYFRDGNGSAEIKEDKLKNFRDDKQGKDKRALLTEEIQKIYDEGYNVLSEANVHDGADKIGDETFSSQFRAFQQSLTAFTEAVKELVKDETHTRKDNVNSYLEELNQMINTSNGDFKLNADGLNGSVMGLTKIKQDVEEILIGPDNLNPNNLKNILKNAGDFYDKIILKHTKETITSIKEYINTQVTAATRAVQREAKMQYYNKIHPMFNDMKISVNHNISVIRYLIENDLTTGVKGLLRTMYKDNGQKLTELKLEGVDTKDKFKNLSERLRDYLDSILKYVQGEVKSPMPSPQPARSNPQSTTVDEIDKAAHKLFDFLAYSNHFDFTFKKHLASLDSSLGAFNPKHFVNAHNPLLLDVTKRALSELTGELGKAYVNKYDGHEDILLYNAKSQKVTDEGRTCAKVLFTVFEILHHDLTLLIKKSNTAWQTYKIDLTTRNKHGVKYEKGKQPEQVVNGLGDFLQQCDYRLTDDPEKQNGELDKNKTGKKIYDELLNVPINSANNNSHLKKCYEGDEKEELTKKTPKDTIHVSDVLDCLMKHLHQYYRACHLGTTSSKTQPSSVHKMLVWLAGFPYSPRYQDFHLNGFNDLFEKPKEKAKEIDTDVITLEIADASGVSLPVQVGDENCLDAYPKRISALDMSQDLTAVCTHAHSVLTAILGHGHENSVYACDYNTNHYGLYYPSDNGACLDMLSDILNRVFHQLRFVYGQCINGPGSSGWAECWYGKEIGGSAWSCNTKQCANQINGKPCKQMVNQNADQTADQTCDKHPTCGLKSPLQSFLEDGLPGFLPHQFAKPGCKLECTVTKHRGIPCKTPMGFADIASMASHTQQGSHLKDILNELCGDSDKPLSQLCATLNCLMRRTPQTLGDMFAFYHQFLYNWDKAGQAHKKNAFDEAVRKANFGDMETTLDVIPLQNTKKHDSHSTGMKKNPKGELFSLISCDYDAKPGLPCGPYLQSISDDICVVYSKKYAGDYVSWVVYITESFYDLLKKLYDDCCNRCNKKGRRCYDKGCDKDCQVRFSHEYDGRNRDTLPQGFDTIKHRTSCNSIVQCRSTHALIYASGFTFGSPYALSGVTDRKWKRTCEDFCTALGRVISDAKADAAPLAKLIHETIPNFLFKIRFPFMTLTLFLWLLSLLYLLHIMVIRLDLLHIKSHLHTPSSHRIAAQSLLAAGRVNKLGRVFYLQP